MDIVSWILGIAAGICCLVVLGAFGALGVAFWQVSRGQKKRRSTSQTQNLPGPPSNPPPIPNQFPSQVQTQSQIQYLRSQLEPKPDRRYVYGFRVWLPHYEERAPYWDITGKTIIEFSELNLRPIAMGGPIWTPGINIAECAISGSLHTAPQEGCHCGFWILDTIEQAIAKARNSGISSYVIGSVVAWGKLIRHSDPGWRAEKVQVVSFLDPDIPINKENIVSAMMGPLRKRAYLLKALSEKYDVPILNRAEIEEFTKSYAEETWRGSRGGADESE